MKLDALRKGGVTPTIRTKSSKFYTDRVIEDNTNELGWVKIYSYMRKV